MIQYPKFPKAIEIQTTSACNAACIICPHFVVSKRLPNGYMKNELFEKIIENIGDKKTLLIPYLNSEPFLDPKFIDRLSSISSKCPNIDVEISTNVSLVDKQKRRELYGLKISELRLSVFGFTPRTYKIMMPGLSWDETKQNLEGIVTDSIFREGIGSIGIVMIDSPEVTEDDFALAQEYCRRNNIKFNFWGFLDRSRNVPNHSNKVYHHNIKGCEQNRPIERMHIGLDGRVILCCQDWTQEYVLGNISKQTIEEVWHSKVYNDVRTAIYGGINPPELCKKCKLSIPK